MINLRESFLESCTEKDVYYKFKKQIETTEDILDKIFYEDIIIYNDADAITLFCKLIQPSNEYTFSESRDYWQLCFYFRENGYYIEQFPSLFNNPTSLFEFANDDIRNYLFLQNRDDAGIIRWSERRKLILELKFKKTKEIISITNEVDEMFKLISTRNSSFYKMTNFEKLKEIANLIEYILKDGKKFHFIDCERVFLKMINNETIKNYRERLQCFRHSSKESLVERNSYTEKQQIFLIDFGILIINQIVELNTLK